MQLMNISLSRRTDLAIKAMDVLARSQERLSGNSLAERIETTIQFLPQVLGPLVRAGWVDSERGPNGGYRAAVPLDSISLLELIEHSEGPLETGRCVLRDGPCPGTESCAVHSAWMAARETLREKLHRTSLANALSMEAQT